MILEELQERDIKTDPHLPVYNLFDAKAQLSEYQRQFRALFSEHLDESEMSVLEESERSVLTMLWELWYFYAYEPWKGAASPRSQVPQWMNIARRQLITHIEEALEKVESAGCQVQLLDYDRKWNNAPSFWIRLDIDDPLELYPKVGALVEAVQVVLGNIKVGNLTHYLIQDMCEYLVIIPIVKGRKLDDWVWPFYMLTILQTEDLRQKPWIFLPRELPEDVREDLNLNLWNDPEILMANQLSSSVAELYQMTSQVAEFQEMPDVTKPGLERFQTYLNKEISEPLNVSLQIFFDTASELRDRFDALPEQEQKQRDNLREAKEALPEVYAYVSPSEDNGESELNLAELIAYNQRLGEAYLIVEAIRLIWIADVLEQTIRR